MKPYGESSNMTTAQKVFNYRLSRARRIVENAFGILVSRFRIFEKPLPFHPDKVIKIVKACCALHNWLRYLKNVDDSVTIHEEDVNSGQTILGNWREVPSDGFITTHYSSNQSPTLHVPLQLWYDHNASHNHKRLLFWFLVATSMALIAAADVMKTLTFSLRLQDYPHLR